MFGLIFISLIVLNTIPAFSQEEPPPEEEEPPVAGDPSCGNGDTCQATIDDGQGGSITVVGTVTYDNGQIYITTEPGITYVILPQEGSSDGGEPDPGSGNTDGEAPPPPPPPPPDDPPPCLASACPPEPPVGYPGGPGICNSSCFSNLDCANGFYCSGYSGTCKRTACPDSFTCDCTNTPPGLLACNQACLGGDQCSSGYCLASICRNAGCPTDASCTCGSPPPSTNSPTTDPGKITVGPGTNTPTNTPTGPATLTPTASPPAAQCTISASASPATINSGQTSTISWTSTNAVGNCTINGPGFQVTGGTSGSQVTGALNPYNSSFYISCVNSQNESCLENVAVTVNVIAACNNTCRSDSDCPSGIKCLTVGTFKYCRNESCVDDGDCNCATTNTPTPPLTATPPPGCNSTCRGNDQCTPYNPAFVCSGGTCKNSACTASGNCICGPGPGTNTDTPTGPGGSPPVTPVEPPYACFRTGCVGASECLAPADTCLGGTCVNFACTAESDCICATGPGTNTYTPTIPGGGGSTRTISGTVFSDGAGNGGTFNNCESGALPLANAIIQVVNDSDGSLIGSRTSDVSGQYTPPITSTTATDVHLIVGNIGTQQVTGVRDGGATFSQPYTPGAGYGFDWLADPDKPLVDICVGPGSTSWYQTSLGDVRFQIVQNPVGDRATASNSVPPSNIFSSAYTSTIPTGRVSANNWQVNREYTEYNSVSTLGSTSYSFYLNQITRAGITPQTIGDTLPSSLTTGASQGFYLKEGNLTINQNTSVAAGNTVVLLVNGDLDIRNPINVANGSILIVAVKGNITIQPNVGVPFISDDVTTAPLQGVYTAERNITILSSALCPTTPDLRLNVSGTLIANSLRPFAGGGNGKVINQRTLCLDNRSFPSLKVYQRASFATGLSTILKSQSRRWSE